MADIRIAGVGIAKISNRLTPNSRPCGGSTIPDLVMLYGIYVTT